MIETTALLDGLSVRGFTPLGILSLGHQTRLFWHPEKRLELAIVALSEVLLVKGMKKYVVLNRAADGRETYERDLPGLMRYMEDHFPEAHVYLSFFRDIPVELAPGYEAAAQAQQRFDEQRGRLTALQDKKAKKKRLASLFEKFDDFSEARSVLSEQGKALGGEETALQAELQRLQATLAGHHEVIRAYQEFGRATLFAFGYSSPLYISSVDDLGATVDAVIADVMNTHHTSVRQKLEGGQLKLFIDELRFPSIFYTAESVGLFSPGQFERLASQLPASAAQDLREAIRSLLQVCPAEDIEVRGHRMPAKRLAAKALWEFLKRVEAVEPPTARANLPTRGAFVGRIMQGERITDTPFYLPLDTLVHAYISGITGSGKSFLLRCIVEGVLAEKRNVVVLDPGNQWASLGLAEDRKEVLDRYRRFGLDRSLARGFPATISQPREMTAEIHTQLENLDEEALVLGFKGLSKAKACDIAADILTALLKTHSRAETGKLRTLVVIEEAHRFAKRKSDGSEAQNAVARVEDAIDLITREGRKYGLNVMIVSQTIRDFSHRVATIRENTTTKIFMHGSDRELDYAADYVKDARQLTALKTGEAFIHNPQFGTVKVAVRPPFSKVIELSATELQRLQASDASSPDGLRSDSDEEAKLLRVIREHFAETGEPINVSQAMAKLGVKSGRRKQQLVDDLEERGLIRSQKLRQRGGPKVLYPTKT